MDSQRRKERSAREVSKQLTSFGGPGDFLFTVAEEEELESCGDIVSDVVVGWFVD